MAQTIDTPGLRRLLDEHDGVQVVEVLPAPEFETEHLPGAIHLPLTGLTRRAAHDALDPDRPVVVYCFDFQWDLSARAACRLEQLGFTDVTDYVDGKAAWFAEGLPAEGQVDDDERVGSLVSPSGDAAVLDAPGDPWAVRPNELVRDVRRRLRDAGDEAPAIVHVTTAKGRLLGTIEVAALLPARRSG